MFGLCVHILGAFADLSFVFRVRSTSYYYRAYSLAAVCCYTVMWLVWLGWLHIARYTKTGLVCSGYYLDEEVGTDYMEGYAVR